MMNETDLTQDSSDINILERIKTDRRFFTLIYRKYYKSIYRYCYFRCNYNKEITEDVVSNVFMRALGAVHRVILNNESKSTLLPWLYVIARNEVNQYYRSIRKGQTPLSEEIINTIYDKSDSIEENETDSYDISLILNEISKMKPIMQDVIFMKLNEDMSFTEIAKTLGKKESAVKMMFYRSLENVTKKLNKVLNK